MSLVCEVTANFNLTKNKEIFLSTKWRGEEGKGCQVKLPSLRQRHVLWEHGRDVCEGRGSACAGAGEPWQLAGPRAHRGVGTSSAWGGWFWEARVSCGKICGGRGVQSLMHAEC